MGSPKRIPPMSLAEFSRHRSAELKKKNAKLGSPSRKPVSKQQNYEQKFSSLLVYGMQLKVRLKHTKDMRVAHCHRMEMKSTEAQMREVAVCAGWTNSDLARMMPQMYRKHHKMISQYEASIRSRSPKRRPPPGPRDKREKPPLSPLAHPSQPKFIDPPELPPTIPSNDKKVLDFDDTPKRLDVQVKPRCVIEVSNCGLKKFEVVILTLIIILSVVVSIIFALFDSI
ncbi:unnamed protein product [Bursaphelenchus xylophilus]|uniref:(pine wood nematode) hypothetical protein n=1 Tax=Bursaphelenchus xylophilus TaxID=6326 RepID=A0A1I7S3V5_BURXY|nr:unnamed protein product [Bursaphelenchus xylophilus]CAG9116526.1 unnamed protein product [Bursaphelenchus xylophilus]